MEKTLPVSDEKGVGTKRTYNRIGTDIQTELQHWKPVLRETKKSKRKGISKKKIRGPRKSNQRGNWQHIIRAENKRGRLSQGGYPRKKPEAGCDDRLKTSHCGQKKDALAFS